jgi:hypothetical protein
MAVVQIPSSPKLLEQVRDKIYSYSTERTYVHWIRRFMLAIMNYAELGIMLDRLHFILFHNKRHPAEMGVPEIEAFLSYLAGP